jgi:hypothetical protein
MKFNLLLLCGFFVAATSFTTRSSEPVKSNNSDTSKVTRCGPWFEITNVSNATVGSTFLTNGTTTFTWATPVFPISIPQQSGTSWTFHTRITAGSNTAVIIKDHSTQEIIACDAARPGEIMDIPFFSGCNVIDIIYTNDLTLCGI